MHFLPLSVASPLFPENFPFDVTHQLHRFLILTPHSRCSKAKIPEIRQLEVSRESYTDLQRQNDRVEA